MKNSIEYLKSAHVLSVNGVKNFDLDWYLRGEDRRKNYAERFGRRPAYQHTSLEAKRHERQEQKETIPVVVRY